MTMGTSESSNNKLNDLPSQYRFTTIATLQSQINAVSRKLRTSQQILYTNEALTGQTCGCFVFGIDYLTGDLYYKDENGNWALIIGGGGGGGLFDAVVNFSVNANPNTGGTTFSPNNPALTTVLYVSTIDFSQWTYDGAQYNTYISPFWTTSGNPSVSASDFIGSINNADFKVRTNNLQRAIFDTSGNFGIATAAPTEKLHVTGNVRFSGALMPNNTAGTSGQVLTSAGAGVVPTWTTPPTTLPISSLTAAAANNTLSLGAFRQHWTVGGTGNAQGALSITATGTGFANNQKSLYMVQSGAHAASGVSTWGAWIENAFTGTNSANVGLVVLVSGATTTTGIIAAANQVAIQGTALTTGIAGLFDRGRIETGSPTFNNGRIDFRGVTSGRITTTTADAAGTYNWIYPITAGTSGQFLTSQGGGSTAMTWTTPSSTIPISSLTAAAAGNTINNANFTQEWQWNSLTNATGLKLISSSTVINGGTVLSVSSDGANSTANKTAEALTIGISNTGTNSTNYGLSVSAADGTNNIAILASAADGTTNYAAKFVRGKVSFGTVGTESAILELGGITSGTATITVAAVAGTPTLTLPTTTGTLALITDIPTATSGTWTPTLSNTTNVTSSTPIICHYTRVGNQVSFSGSVGVVTTLAVATVLGISLPVASNFAALTDATGVGQASTAIATNAYIEANTTTDILELKFLGLSIGGSGTIFFSGHYTII